MRKWVEDEFGENCSSYINDLDTDDEMYVEYKGKPVSFFCDNFKFRGSGDDIFDEYSVCVTPLYFNDSDCAVKLNFKTSYWGVTKLNITCTENKSARYCGAQKEMIYIEFKNRNDKETHGAKFKLKITAKRDYDYNRPNSSAIPSGAIIGGLFGSFFLITVCSDIVCRCLGIRKPSQGRVRTCNPTEGNPATANLYMVYDAETQQSTMTTPSNVTSPSGYPVTLHPSQHVAACPPIIDNKFSSPPPSYDSLMESSTSHVKGAIQESS
ncbi:uncharacterized protein LOC128158660 isoform X2 [Crassostrea angulata]|uniref:uncharacterized protein LOC128158660 isoform X2 n=1 Tax=Magallana angulata TaxID=2784310 RepID=UPI0022B1A96C|nr:uncharacterized protein LOC128158660 isoform X2 [Crassostrea angulata]